MNATEVDARLRRWADAKAIPAAYVTKWLAFGERGRARLLEIVEALSMRTGQCITAVTLLEEISLREGQCVDEILNQSALRRVLTSTASGPGRARELLNKLRALRYPELSRTSQRLYAELAALKLPAGLRIVLPRELASDELRVELVAHGSSELAHLLAWLTAKSGELVQLAAMLAGAAGDHGVA